MYQPYPSAGQMPEPARPEPPDSVLTAVKLMYAGAVVSALSLIVGLATIGSLHTELRNAYPKVTSSQLHTIEVATVVFIVIFGLIGIGLWLWMAMANKRGGNWARITATVFFGLNTLSLLVGFARPEALASRLVGLLIWLIGLGAIVMLWRADSTAFFKAPRVR
jgi:tryptophan-rich sensory protein